MKSWRGRSPPEQGDVRGIASPVLAFILNGMARDPLNFFSPFDELPPNHENQLTRALLVVLRLSPIARATWVAAHRA
jgi:hypothetical protein